MKSIVRFGAGSARALPTHRDHGFEIVLLEKGALNWHAEGRVERVTAGSVYFSFPWEKHGSVDEFEPGHYWQWVQIALRGSIERRRPRFQFHRDVGLGAREAETLSAQFTASRRRCYPATAQMQWLIPALVRELSHPGRQGEDYVNALTKLAVIELGRCIAAAPGGSSLHETGRISGHRVRDFVETLRSRSDETWTLEKMAKQCGLGRTRFALLCRQFTGDSPLTLVNRLRVDRAKALLKTSQSPVTSIALECGFGSSQYFARVFRQFTGMDARSYRAKHRAT